MKILFVCTGNICRSPTAEAILRQYCANADLAWTIDSAGTNGWHTGSPPDQRAQKSARTRNYDLSDITARALCTDDYTRFDRIYAMTEEHRRFLRDNAPSPCPATLILFMETVGQKSDVPDPYYGGPASFEHMINLLERGCRAIVEPYNV